MNTTGLAKEAYEAFCAQALRSTFLRESYGKMLKVKWKDVPEIGTTDFQLAWVAAAKRVQQITRRETMRAVKSVGRVRK